MKTFIQIIVVLSLFTSSFATNLAQPVSSAGLSPRVDSNQPNIVTSIKEIFNKLISSTNDQTEVDITPTVLVTETITPTQAVIIDTPVPSETPTPIMTPDPLAIPTEDIDSDGTIIYENNYVGGFVSLRANPPFIKIGNEVTIHWKLAAEDTVFNPGWTLKISLPDGLVPVSEYAPLYTGNIGEFPITDNKGSIKLLAINNISTENIVNIDILKDGEVWASEQIILGQPFSVVPTGGSIKNTKGIEIEFPENALNEEVDVIILPLTETEKQNTQANLSGFKVEAFTKNGKLVDRFNYPITIKLNYDEILFPGVESSLCLDYYDEETDEWKPLEGFIDPESNLYTAYSEHLTIFNLNPNNFQSPIAIKPDSFQVANLTGAASYSIPIEVPAGPGGLQPKLSLSYNSQSVDQTNVWTQADWVGMGWSLDVPHIMNDFHGTPSDPSDDTVILSMNDGNYRLVRGSDDKYHAENDLFYDIQVLDKNNIPYNMYGDGTGFPGHWVVKTKDGTKYIFGDPTLDFRTYVTSPYVSRFLVACGLAPSFAIYRWSLYKIISPSGKEILFNYTEQQKMGDGHCNNIADDPFDRAVYPSEIRYPNQRYRIYFDFIYDRTDFRDYWTWQRRDFIYYDGRLRSIQVQYDADGDGNFTNAKIVSKYEFTYTKDGIAGLDNSPIFPNYYWDRGDHYLTLNRLQKIAYDANNNPVYQPPLLFHYEDGMHLTRIETGYGGEINYQYDHWYSWNDNANPYTNTNYPDGWKVTATNLPDLEKIGNYYVVRLRNAFAFPGSRYEFHTKFGIPGSIPVTVQVGLDDGFGVVRKENGEVGYDTYPLFQPSQTNVIYDKAYTMPGTANPSQAMFKIFCQENANFPCRIWNFQVRRLPTYYRVISKTITDHVTQTSYSYSYSYEGPSVNNEIGFGEFVRPKTDFLVFPYSSFRGHSKVIVTGPDGKKVETTYHQLNKNNPTFEQLYLTGSPISTKTYTNPTPAIPLTSVDYSYATNGPVTAKLNRFYVDLKIRWVRPTSEISKQYTADGSGWMGIKTKHVYDPIYQGGTQYGNQTQMVESVWESGSWKDVRLQWSRFYPTNNGTKFLTGLPAVTSLYKCVGTYDGNCFNEGGGAPSTLNILSSTQFLYDNSVNYQAVPTNGILTGQRVLLRWQNPALGQDPLFSDVSYGYDTWGNRTTITQYQQENNDSGFGAGSSSTTKTCFGDPSTDPACANDGIYTFPLWQRNALNQIVYWTYDYAIQKPIQETGLNGEITTGTYDEFGRIKKIVRPGDSLESPTIQTTYDDFGTPFSVQSTKKINISQFSSVRTYYNGFGELIQTQQLDALVNGITQDILVSNRIRFDSVNGVSLTDQSMPYEISEATGYVATDWNSLAYTTTKTDVMGRVKSIIPPDSNIQNYSYSVNAATSRLQTTYTDPRSNNTISYSDALGRLMQIVPATGPGVTYTYDEADRLTGALYGSAQTTITYNLAGQKTAMNDPDMGIWLYQYDASGNLIRQTDARGKRICLYYDPINRLSGKHYRDDDLCPTSNPTYHVSYGYDSGVYGNGLRTSMLDASGSTSWVYNSRGLLTQESKTVTGSGTFKTEWDYNSADQLALIRYPAGNTNATGEVVNYSYTPQLTIDSVSGSSNYVTQTMYDSAGRMTQRSLGGTLGNSALQQNYSYYGWAETAGNPAIGQGGRLKALSAGVPMTPTSLVDFSYIYDQNGNLAKITDDRMNMQVGYYQDFQYDEINRLTDYMLSDGGPAFDREFIYDPITGNLIFKDSVVLGYSASVSCPGGGRTIPHAVSSTGTNSYTYDCNGNMIGRTISGSANTLTYDYENRLTGVSGAASASFIYDGDGNRVKATLNGQTTVYIGGYFEWTGSSSTMKKYYSAGVNRIAVRTGDGTGDSGLLYLLGDHLGSTTVAANPDGTLNSKQLYMPFGESRYTNGSLPTDYKFTGQMEEPELGLYYYNARYYDPYLGRFISADTIIPQPGNPIAFDRYAYVNNNPIRYTDSTGHCVDGSITTYLCIAMAAGALASYAIQVGENRKAGMDWGEALTTDISGERIVEGALLAGGVIVGAAAVSAGVGAIGTTANAACSDGDCTNEVGIAGQGSSSIWNMNPLERGVVIENILGRSPFLPQNFPVIDRWENGIATSYKSIDLAAKTYQDLAALSYKVQNYVTTLANWTGTNWGGITITSSEIIGRELILAIPPNASQAQLFVLQQLQVWAQDQGVILIINIIE